LSIDPITTTTRTHIKIFGLYYIFELTSVIPLILNVLLIQNWFDTNHMFYITIPHINSCRSNIIQIGTHITRYNNNTYNPIYVDMFMWFLLSPSELSASSSFSLLRIRLNFLRSTNKTISYIN
jgi:hypothetical protein